MVTPPMGLVKKGLLLTRIKSRKAWQKAAVRLRRSLSDRENRVRTEGSKVGRVGVKAFWIDRRLVGRMKARVLRLDNKVKLLE